MTYLEQLLGGKEVAWKPLGEIGKVCMCRRIFREQTSPRGDIPFYKIGTFGKEADAYISYELYEEYRRRYPFPKKGDVLISASGTIGRLVVYDGAPAYFQDSNIVWIDNDESLVLNRFLYHYYGIVRWKTDKGTIERLYNRNLEKVLIPLPPLAVQEQIVAILDKFTALIEALETELALRTRQYAYYRNKLLRFGEEVEWRALGEVAVRTRGTNITALRMRELNKENAPIKIFAGGKTVAYLDYEDLPLKDIQTIPSIIVKSRGIVEFEYYDQPFSHKNELWAYHSENRALETKFVYYFLKTQEPRLRRKAETMGTIPQISVADTEKLLIPLPPLAVQEQIVTILDKFHTLVHSISEGLPAEIALRRRQYEYYRNLLLRFPPPVRP